MATNLREQRTPKVIRDRKANRKRAENPPLQTRDATAADPPDIWPRTVVYPATQSATIAKGRATWKRYVERKTQIMDGRLTSISRPPQPTRRKKTSPRSSTGSTLRVIKTSARDAQFLLPGGQTRRRQKSRMRQRQLIQLIAMRQQQLIA